MIYRLVYPNFYHKKLYYKPLKIVLFIIFISLIHNNFLCVDCTTIFLKFGFQLCF
ncbi:hypothetical protein HanPSC8_Chr11g0492071 [Helianthus annuus]|nr:hypothetical protein HanPSC8_Chr11g0492071 [Helianthus annuus]